MAKTKRVAQNRPCIEMNFLNIDATIKWQQQSYLMPFLSQYIWEWADNVGQPPGLNKWIYLRGSEQNFHEDYVPEILLG